MAGPKLDMSADPEEFTEAVSEFASRRVVTRAEADTLEAYARRRAWWITGVAQMDVVQDVQDTITTAMRNGTPFQKWKQAAGDMLRKAWGKKDSFRLETIFRNAVSQAFNAGRLDQITQPHIVAMRPYHMLDVVDDTRTSSTCKPFVNPKVVLPADDPWWTSHSPPLHHRCRSGIRSLRAETAQARGITAKAPEGAAAKGFGVPPNLAEPPKPSERENKPDPELALECAVKGGKDYRERKPVTIPKRFVKKTA